MLNPSYSTLIKTVNQDSLLDNKITSRYSIVIAASKRARQIVNGAHYDTNRANTDKAVSIAVSELERGHLRIVPVDDDAIIPAVDPAISAILDDNYQGIAADEDYDDEADGEDLDDADVADFDDFDDFDEEIDDDMEEFSYEDDSDNDEDDDYN
ncbi:MAG: DNA-directed RNA polymerase subunit omega [Defluviitaleaceae bacterium]|nr:DNA-directed RNA polymerase subunit omega [Defluviitaleaceae bacterium]